MGSITLQVIGDVTVGTKSKTYTVSDADVNRLVNCWKALMTSATVPSPTVTQALVGWADTTLQQTKGTVLDYERQVSAASIAPITAT